MKKDILISTKQWLEAIVVGMALCPFAASELLAARVRFSVSAANTEEQLLLDLQSECELLAQNADIETTLLIHPEILQDFYDYNDFLVHAHELLRLLDLEGVFQIASFHPRYQFSDTAADAASNYTNRSPYPMLHILREESVARAIAKHPDIASIPATNIAAMERIGQQAMEQRLQHFLKPQH